MKDALEVVLDWLHDAHAMEKQAESMLSTFAGRLENYPELKLRVEENMRVAQSHQRTLKDCIEKIGGNVSTVKDVGAKLLGISQSLSGIFVGDEVVKGILSISVFQQMAVASYTVLGSAAKYLGDTRIDQACDDMLSESVTIAEKLEAYLPAITEQYLARVSASPGTAKR